MKVNWGMEILNKKIVSDIYGPVLTQHWGNDYGVWYILEVVKLYLICGSDAGKINQAYDPSATVTYETIPVCDGG